jgi:phosphate transport system substrate-binding protein
MIIDSDRIEQPQSHDLEKPLGGRYQIVQQLGTGGFSQTFLAEDLHLPNRPRCVIKQLNPHFETDEDLQTARRLFNTEAEVLYLLGSHDQIPRLLAHFEEDQKFYLAQELIVGEPLSQSLADKPVWTQAEVAILLRDLLAVLAFVHEKGVIHRDIKPSNLIRRQQDGKIMLIDFGAVKQVSRGSADSKSERTDLTITIGTQGYTPVEQLAGEPRFSSDVYAVGMVAIRALTDIRPKNLRRDPLTHEFQWWQEGVSVCPELAVFLNCMIRYDYRERYSTANEALAVLQSISAYLPGYSPEQWSTDQPNRSLAKPLPSVSRANSSETSPPARKPLELQNQNKSLALIPLTKRNLPEVSRTPKRSPNPHSAPPTPTKPQASTKMFLKYLVPLEWLAATGIAVLLTNSLLSPQTIVPWLTQRSEEVPVSVSTQEPNDSTSPADTETPAGTETPAANNFGEILNVPIGLFNYGGSTTWAPIRGEVDAVLQAAHPGFRLRYTHPVNATPGSGTGIRMLLEGQLAFAQSSRPLEDQEYQQAQIRGFRLEQIPVAIDGIAIAVHPSLSVPGLNIQQLQDIYTGKITNWQQVGGPNLKITPYSRRSADGGTVEFFVKNVLSDNPLGSDVQYVYDTTDGLRKLAQDPGGIYYASAPAIISQCGVKALAIAQEANNFVSPYQAPLPQEECSQGKGQLNVDALRTGEYPITRQLFVIIRLDGQTDQEVGEAYAKLLLTHEGQELISKAGFVKIR